jgi:hypothetical protein
VPVLGTSLLHALPCVPYFFLLCSGCCLQDPGPSPGQAPNGDELLLLAEPVARANSFVGTEEYLAPEVRRRPGGGALAAGQAV